MTSVLFGMLSVVGVAIAVVAMVAYPHLRQGSPLLSAEGERLARESTRRARALADQAAQRGAEAVSNVKDFATGGGDETVAVTATTVPTGPPQQKSSPAATPPPGTALGVAVGAVVGAQQGEGRSAR